MLSTFPFCYVISLYIKRKLPLLEWEHNTYYQIHYQSISERRSAERALWTALTFCWALNWAHPFCLSWALNWALSVTFCWAPNWAQRSVQTWKFLDFWITFCIKLKKFCFLTRAIGCFSLNVPLNYQKFVFALDNSILRQLVQENKTLELYRSERWIERWAQGSERWIER